MADERNHPEQRRANTMWMRSVERLAAAAAGPRACKWEWDHREGTALLEAGRLRDVLTVPGRLGLLTLDLLWRPGLPVPGPTLVNRRGAEIGRGADRSPVPVVPRGWRT